MKSDAKRPRLGVAQIVETLDTGGAEHLAIKFANALARRGHRSGLIVTSHSGPLEAAVADGVTLKILGYRRASITNPFRFAGSIRRGFGLLAGAVRELEADIVQTHLPTPNFWGLALHDRGVCRSVATIHNNQEFSYGSRHSLRGRLRHGAYRAIVRRCAATIAVSDQVRKSFLEELGLADAPRLVSIPNGVDIPPAPDPETRRKVREGLGVGDGTILGLGVGRICEQKNFKDLLPVVERLAGKGLPFRVVIAGDGPDLPELKELITRHGLEEAVIPLGNVTNVPEILAASDVFLMPSLWEGLPLALLEAMASGLPVVGNAIDGLTDVILEGRTGFLVDPGAHDDMAAALEKLVVDPDMRREFGGAGRALVEERYNLSRVVDDIEDLYYLIGHEGR